MVAIFYLLISSAVTFAAARNVLVDVKSPWEKSSSLYLAELAEFLSEQSPESYWKFIESVCSHSGKIDTLLEQGSIESSAELQALAFDAASSIAPPTVHSLMDTMLGLGVYAPAMEFFRTISSRYGNACHDKAFVVLYPRGEVVCELPEELSAFAEGQEDSYFRSDWDHVYPARDENTAPQVTAVLYGSIGTSSFCNLHIALASLANQGSVLYSARPSFQGIQSMANETFIQGFGVFLDIKNMEYKNYDDKEVSAKELQEDKTISFDEGEEVSGISFSTLAKRRSDLLKELQMLRSELTEKSAEESTEMKVWKMKDLGLQTLQAVRAAKNPLEKLTDIVQNFPMHAPALSSIKTSSELRDETLMFWQSGVWQMLLNNVYINGLRIPLDGNTFNVYDLINKVREEMVLMQKLPRDISPQLQLALQRTAVNVAGAKSSTSGGPNDLNNIIRVDVSKGGKHVITFINNLEKDEMYKSWPKRLRQLTMPSWSLQAVARNIYSVVAVIDPFTLVGATMSLQMQIMWQQQYPVRFGFVFDCKPSGVDRALTEPPQEDGHHVNMTESAGSDDFCRLFAAARETYGVEEASEFLFYVANAVTSESMKEDYSGRAIFSRAKLVELFAKGVSGSSAKKLRVFGKKVLLEQQHSEFVKNSTNYLAARGLPTDSFSMNGIINTDGDINSSLMQLLGREQYILSQHIRAKTITDKTTSIFSAIVATGGAHIRYHPMLEEADVNYVDTASATFEKLLQKISLYRQSFSAASNEHGYFTEPNDSFQSPSLVNTTLVFFPATSQGFASAASALTWSSQVAAFGTQQVAVIPYFSETPKNDCTADNGQDSCPNDSNLDADRLHALAAFDEVFCSLEVSSETNWDNCGLVGIELKAALLEYFATGDSIVQVGLKLKAHPLAQDNSKVVLQLLDDWIAKTSADSRTTEGLVTANRLFKAVPGLFKQEDDSSVYVVYNSRILVHSSETPLHNLDFDLLASMEEGRIGSSIIDDVRAQFDSATTRDSENWKKYLDLCSYVGVYGTSGSHRTDVISTLEGVGVNSNSQLYFEIQSTDSDIGNRLDMTVVFVLDPLTMAGQRGVTVIKLFQDQLHIPVKLVLVPKPELTEFPLQNFYRFVLAPHSRGLSADELATSNDGKAVFRSLPRQHMLTVRIDAPEPWNVQATSASQDIDSLRCESSSCGDITADGVQTDTTSITYTLKNLLVAGQCFEHKTSVRHQLVPPNGLQLTLTPTRMSLSDASNKRSDTLVMQNLGYFQLQANPGLWDLNLAAGRATELYAINDGNDKRDAGLVVPVRSFGNTLTKLMVSKRPGKEHIPLLQDSTSDDQAFDDDELENGGAFGSVWDSVSSFFGSSESSKKAPKKSIKHAALQSSQSDDNRIHVFSLATGHMYERLLRIMMLSVTKRTSVPVKFWLFENFLSPTFKQIAQVMSETYGFEIGYVTYKWPEWLTQQTQKQRIIWGYKILFLDVLFPLNVKKIIYVDADQVLRADLKELWDLDLQGKPYAYTPFCTSRQETLGFQFWRQGFWSDHLRGKPYHISALYVVDLQKFRRKAVGDQLRSIYDGLARDPNSLANLDQDLPNFAQHSVPIHSLPQEWLWCETWCSDESKATAKTIDLCNNPLHKEPKLDMARRIISGKLFNESWVELDQEIRELGRIKGFSF